MSVVSMVLTTGAFAWLFTRRTLEPLFQQLVVSLLGGFAVLFGLW